MNSDCVPRATLIRDDMPLLQSINAKMFRTFGEMALDFVKKIRSLVFSLHPLSSISLIDMTFKTLSKRQNGTVDPSLFSLHLIEGRVIPDWKKFISSGENIIRSLGDYIAKHIRQNSSLQEGQSLYLAGLFSNPETDKMLNQNGMLDCTVVWQSYKKRWIPA